MEDGYLVTGLKYQSQTRFRIFTISFPYAMSINLWRGNVWEVKNGKRKRIKSVWN